MKLFVVIIGSVFLTQVFLYGLAFSQQKVIQLTFGSIYPPDHPLSLVDKKWIEKIEKDTAGGIKIKPYWAGTLLSSRESLDEIVKGVVDIGVAHPSQARTGYPIHRSSYLFYYGADQQIGRQVFVSLLKRFPDIENEYKGLKVLAWASGVDYQLLSRRPIKKIEDMKGMRVRVTAELAEVVKKLGAEGIIVPSPEVYEQMQKGILDATFIGYDGLKGFKLAEVAKYLTVLDFYRPHSGCRMMNLNTWNNLPDPIKKVFESSIEWYGLETDRQFEQDHRLGIEFGKSMGVEFIRLSKEEIEKFYTVVREIATQKAKDLDKTGLPGTAILAEAQRLIQEQKK